MKAFEIKANGKILDYRVGALLNLDEVKKFFEEKGYVVKKIWQEKRHVVGIIEHKHVESFLKLSPTEGISVTTQIDYKWNSEFNRLAGNNSKFCVPRNYESGVYQENLFYIVEEFFDGNLLAKRPAPGVENQEYKKHINQIIELSELIQNLKVESLSEKDDEDYAEWFLEKTKSWYAEIPQQAIDRYNINELLRIVEDSYKNLRMKTRHGDFTPWHMISLANGKLGLIDGEHAMRNGVEYYDIGYLIQRIFSVLEDPDFAKEVFEILKNRKYNLDKLRVILASRAIGGFCDEMLMVDNPNLDRANKFKECVISL
jgi:hypothetical protein